MARGIDEPWEAYVERVKREAFMQDPPPITRSLTTDEVEADMWAFIDEMETRIEKRRRRRHDVVR